METLKVAEIFQSIQGEGTSAGLRCSFVRLAGCNLRCNWCDTAYAWDGGDDMTVEQIARRMGEMDCPLVELTGGEPLLQPLAGALLTRLCDDGFTVLLETNGSLDISGVDVRVTRIMDVKCLSSGHSEDNLWSNLDVLAERDEVKFVIADRADYEYARQVVQQHRLGGRCHVIFSPMMLSSVTVSPDADEPEAPGAEVAPPAKRGPAMRACDVAEWIIADHLDVRFGVQLHKVLWPGKDRGV